MDSVPGRVRGVDDFPSISARPRDKFHVGYEFAEAIRNAVRLGFVERQPTYLLDFAIWPHRGGPGCGRVLATWDGLLLGQCGLRLGLEQVFGDPDGSFERSFHEPDVTNDEMEKLRHRWHQLRPKRYPWSMGDSEIAIHLTYGINKSLHAFNSSSKSDGHKDQLYTMAFGNLITDVTAITIDPSHIPDMRASLGVPFLDDPELWDRSWQWSARVGELVAEAYASRRSSDRACVVMLRTACEVLLAEFAEREGAPAPLGKHFDTDIVNFEKVWIANTGETQPTGSAQRLPSQPAAAERARRAAVIAALHRIRDLGNRIHGSESVSAAAADETLDAMLQLLRACSGDSSIFRSTTK